MNRKLLWRQANALKEQGRKACDAKDWERAQTAYRAALDLYTQINVRSLQGRMLEEMAFIAGKRSLLSDAHAYYKQALALNLGAPCLKSAIIRSLAYLYVQQGDREAACALIPQMWACLEQQRNRAFYVFRFSDIGQFAEEIEAYDLANESYRKALHYDALISRGRGDPLMILYYMGRVARKQGLYVISCGFHAEALRLCEQNRFSTMQPRILQSWALLEQAAAHLESARNLIRLAYIDTERVMERSGYNERMRSEILQDYLAITGTPFD